MKSARFEEKEYEGPLYQQLLGGSHRISTPGQVFEFAFGVDACLEALNPVFWNSVGLPVAPSGIVLDRMPLNWVWDVFGSKRRLPTFSVNLLIQAKRPDFLKGVRSDFKPHGIHGHYWRFFTTPHQQKALLRLSQSLGERALVVYASPAFHSHDHLYQHTDERTMVEHSTFVTPDILDGHRSWNYDRPGTSGIAASIPSSHNGPNFFAMLEGCVAKSQFEQASSSLMEISAAVERTVNSLEGNPIADRYKTIVDRSFKKNIDKPIKPEIAAFQRSLLFFSLVGLNWFVAGPASSEGLKHN